MKQTQKQKQRRDDESLYFDHPQETKPHEGEDVTDLLSDIDELLAAFGSAQEFVEGYKQRGGQ